MKKSAAGALTILVGAALVFTAVNHGKKNLSEFFVTRGDVLLPAVSSGDSAPGGKDAQELRADIETGASEPEPGIRGENYPIYLDEICPRLTQAEEDRLIANHPDDASILVGLVFAKSPNWKRHLENALKLAPNDPLVHYAVLAKGSVGQADENFDRLKSALELARLSPNDSAPLHAAALEALRRGDRQGALSFLTEAQFKTEFSSWRQATLQLAIDTYVSAGRPVNDATGRVMIEIQAKWEGATQSALVQALGVLSPDWRTLWASEQVAGLMINAAQQAIEAPGFDISHYACAYTGEVEFIRAILYSPNPTLGNYSQEDLTYIFNNAQEEFAKFRYEGFFGNDKVGIYKMMSGSERAEFINRVSNEGEIPAMLWAHQARPDIFASPDFIPLGMSKQTWTLLKNQGK